MFDAKPAIIKAFNAAKSLDTKKQRGKAREIGDAYLEFVEFRMFLVNLHQYFEYLAVFDEVAFPFFSLKKNLTSLLSFFLSFSL